jgi:hypothetical protein
LALVDLEYYYLVTLGVLGWIATVFFIMKRDDNFTYLKNILKEKGAA